MEHALALHSPATREDSSPSATDDPLDLQGLWPITTDFTNAARRVATSVSAIARSLSQDNDVAASSLRQMLLEIRARLVYLVFDVSVGVVAGTSQLIDITAKVIAAHLQNDPRADSPASLAYFVTMILETCSTSNLLLLDTITAYDVFFASFQQYQSRAPRLHTRTVASMLHSIGTFVSPAVSPSHSPTPDAQQTSTIHSIRLDLTQMNTSLDRIEAFWRKRQSLYVGSGYTFGREQMVRFYQSCSQLGAPYMHFVNPLSNSQDALCKAQPSIDVSPATLNEETKSQSSWRSLLT